MSKNLFISYSHKDVAAVEQIVHSIESAADCDVWFDHKLKGGEEYFSVIADQILQCDYFLFVVSPYSVTSNFCIRELEFAMSENRKIIAVWLEEFTPPPRVRLVISNTHYIRNQGLTDADFSHAIADALEAEHLTLGGEAEYILSEQKTDSEKYFVSPEDKAKMQRLLEKEQKEDFLACFEPEAAVLLGLAYEMGVGVDTDETRADFYYHIASYKGSLDGEYLMLALRLAQGKADKAATVRRMSELAEAGCLKALVYWGDELYLGNYGMTVDKPTAYRWFKRAADMGDPVAKYFLAFGYRVGEVGEEADYTLAWMYFLEAAQQHFPRAYRQMAIMYRKGQLVEKSDEKAREYYQKAIDNGDGLAINYLGNMEHDAGDYDKAFECYSQAVDYAKQKKLPNGNPYYNLGWAYEYGQGVEKDIARAIDLYLTAAGYRHKSSARRVAYMIAKELEADMETKRALLEKAVACNCTNAEYWMARTYEWEAADGDRAQCKEALEWYEKGADKGDLYAIESCIDYYSWVQGGKEFVDRDTALQYFRLYFSVFDLPDNEKFRKTRSDTMLLQSLYYAYAVELGIDKDNLKPDKQHALYYYQKCLQCPQGEKHWKKILGIAYRYASGEGGQYADRFYKDVPFAEDIVATCEPFLDRVIEAGEDVDSCVSWLTTCYNVFAAHYQENGNDQGKKSAEYRLKKINAEDKLKEHKKTE